MPQDCSVYLTFPDQDCERSLPAMEGQTPSTAAPIALPPPPTNTTPLLLPAFLVRGLWNAAQDPVLDPFRNPPLQQPFSPLTGLFKHPITGVEIGSSQHATWVSAAAIVQLQDAKYDEMVAEDPAARLIYRDDEGEDVVVSNLMLLWMIQPRSQ